MTPDPYDPVPTYWERHASWVAPLAVVVLTVFLQVASFPPLHAPEAAYACLAPGIFWAYLRPRFKTYAWTLFIAQAIAWTINLSWLHPVTWVGLFLMGPFVGAWTGTWFLCAWWAMPRIIGRPTPVRLFAMLGLSAAWVLVEWTRTWLLTGFPWMPLAATQWQMLAVIQIAAYTGAWGISFVIVASNIGIAAVVHRLFLEGEKGLKRRSQELLLSLFLMLVCLAIFVSDTTRRSLFWEPFADVAIVQPDIAATVKWEPSKAPEILRVLQDTTIRAGAMRPDLVLWPESTLPLALKGGDPRGARFVESLSARVKAPMLVGADAIEAEDSDSPRYYNAAFVIDPKAGVRPGYYAKQHLVPFGEYVPLHPILGWLKKVVPIGDDFSTGSSSSPLVVPMSKGAAAFGVLICYEDLFPSIAREEVRSGADALVVVTNDAWYGEGAAAYQHAAHSVLRAVETRRPVLRCGNAGWSGWIDEFGTIRRVMLNDDDSVYFRGAGLARVSRDQRWIGRRSFYVEHGDWFVGACAVLALAAFAMLAANKPLSERAASEAV